MRRFKYIEFIDEDIELVKVKTEKEVLDMYWDYWVSKMKQVEREHLISEENCIQDWVVINWAWEL